MSEEKHSRLLKELENTSDILEQMVTTLAHDIRVPLATILGWTAMRKSGQPEKTSQIDHAFEVIERNAQKQVQLIRGISRCATRLRPAAL
jgi:signal transduction histidine kinase